MRIHTIGHSARAQGELIALLTEAGVALLIDARSYPRSRRNPQFDAQVLEAALGEAGIGYAHLKALGGKRGPAKDAAPSPNAAWREPGLRDYADYALTPAFRAGLEALRGLARARPTAIMCAEGHWSQCHRQIIADYLLAAGARDHRLWDTLSLFLTGSSCKDRKISELRHNEQTSRCAWLRRLPAAT